MLRVLLIMLQVLQLFIRKNKRIKNAMDIYISLHIFKKTLNRLKPRVDAKNYPPSTLVYIYLKVVKNTAAAFFQKS